MFHNPFYKPDAIYTYCGYGNHKQNLIFHCREMVLEERPVIMLWLVLSAAYRVLFIDLMDNVGVLGEDNIKIGCINYKLLCLWPFTIVQLKHHDH
jgi:hypothetical protein